VKRLWAELRLVNRGARGVMRWAHLGLVLACAALFGLFTLTGAAARYVESHLLGALPDQELRISLRKKAMGVLRLNDPDAPAAIAESDLAAMAALPEVREVFPLAYGTQPCYVRIDFLGQRFTSEMVVQAIDPAWIAEDIPPEKLAWRPGEPLPVALNAQLLAIYNSGYAKSQGLPEISGEALTGFDWTFSYGQGAKNYGGPDAFTMKARVVGFSGKAALGAAVPRAALDYLHERLNVDPAPITEAALALRQDAEVEAARAGVAALGFDVAEPDAFARTFRTLRRLAAWAGLGLTLCVCLFAFGFLNHTLAMLFLLKRRDYAVCLAMGMSRARLRGLLALELLGAIGLDLMAGLFAGWLAALALNQWTMSDLLLDLTGVPLTLSFSWATAAFLAGATLLAGALALGPRVWTFTSRPAAELLGKF